MSNQGWHPDPNDPSKLRFWDGSVWTDFTKPNPDAAAAAPAAPPTAPPSNPGAGPVRLPRRNDPAQPERPAGMQQDPYAATQAVRQVNTDSPHDPYAAGAGQQHGQDHGRPHDPYAHGAGQPAPPQYGQRADVPGQQGGHPPQPQPADHGGGIVGSVHRFNDSIAQGYGDQTFGGHMTGPAGHYVAGADRSLLDEKTLVVSQKRKIIEVTNEYTIYASDGATLGAVVQVGQSSMRKAVRFMTNVDQFLTHRLEVRNNSGQVLLQLTRPAKFMKSSVIVADPQGNEIGRLIQRNVFGKIRFGMEAGGQEIGSINAQNWRAWNFVLQDAQGTEIATVTKTWEGLMTTMFTTADNYAVRIHYDLPEPLRSLCVAAALTIDTALKQDDR